MTSRPAPTHPIPRRARGFTLLEITLAVLIFAVIVAGLASAINRAGDVIGLGLREVRMRAALEAHLAELRVNPAAVPPEPAAGVEITRAIEPVFLTARDGTPLAGLCRVRLTAARPGMAWDPDPPVLEEWVYFPAEMPVTP